MVRELARTAGITKKVTPHVLRHTFATAILRNGGDIRFIQQLLGHSSVATTQIYTHVDDSALKEMYQKHRPNY
jgi:integrase/recombinase XerD